jgi:hypothetical protein
MNVVEIQNHARAEKHIDCLSMQEKRKRHSFQPRTVAMDGAAQPEAREYLEKTVYPSIVTGLTKMGLLRPKDPHLWLGKFLLAKADANVAQIVLRDGSALPVHGDTSAANRNQTHSPLPEDANDEGRAAATIQSRVRGIRGRRRASLRKEEVLFPHATKVQTIWRGKLQRAHFAQLRSNYMEEFMGLFQPLSEDMIDTLYPGDVVRTVPAEVMAGISDDRWREVYDDKWAQCKADYPKWAGVMAEVDGDDADCPRGIDEEDFSVKIKVYTELSPDLPQIDGGAWWPVELLMVKPEGALVDKRKLHERVLRKLAATRPKGSSADAGPATVAAQSPAP